MARPQGVRANGDLLSIQGIQGAFDDPGVWNDPAVPLHVRQHVHYLDWAVLSDLSPGECGAVVQKWIAQYDMDDPVAWAPYPTATRALALVRMARHLIGSGAISGPEFAALLARHGAVLRRTAEWDVDGNHLFRAGAGLVAVGAALEGRAGRKALGAGSEIIDYCIPRQVMPDGGHIERSAWYHCMVLSDLLCCLRIVDAVRTERRGWLDAAASMVRWIQKIRGAGGRVPLLGDSCEAAGPFGDTLVGVFGTSCTDTPPPGGARYLPDTKLFRVDTDVASWSFNVGPTGDWSVPGHTHADIFSFEMWTARGPVIVDQGVVTYSGPDRIRSRATAAHNTLAVNDRDQLEMWGNFRVGRWTEPSDVKLNDKSIRARHDGYRNCGWVHERLMEWDQNRVTIADTLHPTQGRGTDHKANVTRRLRFADGISVQSQGDRLLIQGCGIKMSIQADGEWSLQKSEWWPGWGMRRPATEAEVRTTVHGRWRGSMTLHALSDEL